MNTSSQANTANPDYRAQKVDEKASNDIVSFEIIIEEIKAIAQRLDDCESAIKADNVRLPEMMERHSQHSCVINNRGRNEGNTNHTENRMHPHVERRRTTKRKWESRRQASGSALNYASTNQDPHGRRTSSTSPSASNSNVIVEETDQGDSTYNPNEPRYCICNQVSNGDMIACDYRECKQEWFHFSCVAVTSPPKGKWYCPQCRINMRRKREKIKKP